MIRWTFILALLSMSGFALGQENFFANPRIDDAKSWSHVPALAGVKFKFDRKVGKTKKGSLFIANKGGKVDRPNNWRQICDVTKAKGPRFRLAASARAKNFKSGSVARICAQVWDADQKQISFVQTDPITQDSDWQDVEIIFDTPPNTASLFVMAYLVGEGEIWWDDFVLEETEERTSPLPAPVLGGRADSESEERVRAIGHHIPWIYESGPAYDRSISTNKPQLVYVRCTDDVAGLNSARKDIRSQEVNFKDDGHVKDLLFRAGPLTDPLVSDIITRRFIPVCATYHLATIGQDQVKIDWYKWKPGGAISRRDPVVGLSKPGSLYLESAPGAWGAWLQSFTRPKPGLYEFQIRIKTSDLASGAFPEIDFTAIFSTEPKVIANRSKEITGDDEWKFMKVQLEIPAGALNMSVRVKLLGEGKLWCDEGELRRKGDPKNILRDPGIDRDPEGDPLLAWGCKSVDIVTPALIVVNAEGKQTHRLHRIGALSSEFIDRWLRDVLSELKLDSDAESAQEAFRDGDLDRAKRLLGRPKDDASLELEGLIALREGQLKKAASRLKRVETPLAIKGRGYLAMREGAWAKAEKEFAKLVANKDPVDEEARYQLGLCRQRQGQLGEAMSVWAESKSKAPFGLKSQLAALRQGPRPWLAETVRSWPKTATIPEYTETDDLKGFDAKESVRLLISLQKDDGSFTGHSGVVGYWDPALTALAVEALERWRSKMRGVDRTATEAAVEKGLLWLEQWATRPKGRLDPFNAPYALETLLDYNRLDAAKKVVAKILAGQERDGNWTIYHAERPISFNTAQCILALVEARKKRIDVPKKTIDRAAMALNAMRSDKGFFPYSTAEGHDWMTTEHAAISRDPLCEHALIAAKKGKPARLQSALERFLKHQAELRIPTKKLYNYFNRRGHGGYFFFYAHRNALEAARRTNAKMRREIIKVARGATLAAREGDGSFMDHFVIGRAYATAMALCILAE